MPISTLLPPGESVLVNGISTVNGIGSGARKLGSKLRVYSGGSRTGPAGVPDQVLKSSGNVLLTLKECGHGLDKDVRYAIWGWDQI